MFNIKVFNFWCRNSTRRRSAWKSCKKGSISSITNFKNCKIVGKIGKIHQNKLSAYPFALYYLSEQEEKFGAVDEHSGSKHWKFSFENMVLVKSLLYISFFVGNEAKGWTSKRA